MFYDLLRYFRTHPLSLLSLVVAFVFIILGWLSPLLPTHDYAEQIPQHANLPPSLMPAGELIYQREKSRLEFNARKQNRELNSAEQSSLEEMQKNIQVQTRNIRGEDNLISQRRYLLGTDDLGRDLLARILYGSRISITVGFIGALVSIVLGLIIGSIAGYFGGKIDAVIMRLIDIIYSLPYMLIVIVLVSLLNRSVANLFIALALVSWLTVARVVRAQVLSLRRSDFIVAARLMGASHFYIIFKHIIPNIVGLVIIFTTLRIPSFIIMEAFLSFLGLGISPPMTSWGLLISEGAGSMNEYPWKLFYPSIAMSLFLLSLNFVGDALRQSLDPKLRR